MTFEVLAVIANNPAYSKIIERSGGPLLAARAIADRFDRYHVRRPAMIREWEKGIPILSPTANDEVLDGQRVIKTLNLDDHVAVRLMACRPKRIGEPSPPARQLQPNGDVPKQLLVVGLQSLSLHQIEVLQHLAKVCEIKVLLVHPSAPLQQRWANTTPSYSWSRTITQ